MNDYSTGIYDTPTSGEMASVLGVGIGFIIFYMIFIIALTCLMCGSIAGLSHMFAKAGKKPWKAVIPFYNVYVLFDLSWSKHRFWFWLGGAIAYIGANSVMFVHVIISAIQKASTSMYGYSSAGTDLSVIGIGSDIGLSLLAFAGFVVMLVFQIILCIKVARSYGKGTGYVWGLMLIPAIFYMVLGFGSAWYLGSNQPSPKQRQNQYIQDQSGYAEEMHTADKEQ